MTVLELTNLRNKLTAIVAVHGNAPTQSQWTGLQFPNPSITYLTGGEFNELLMKGYLRVFQPPVITSPSLPVADTPPPPAPPID